MWEFIDYIIIDTAERLSPTSADITKLPSSTTKNSEADLFQTDPAFKKYIERFVGSQERINIDDLCEGMSLLFKSIK